MRRNRKRKGWKGQEVESSVSGMEGGMEEPRKAALEDQLIRRWREIEDMDATEDELTIEKEKWFGQAFSFVRDLPEDSHCWCAHKEVMLPLLEPFYGYYIGEASSTSLQILWRRVSREMRRCTSCVSQHHKAKEFYSSEFAEEVVRPLLDTLQVLDEERVVAHMKELLRKFETDSLDTNEDSYEVICIIYEILTFPSCLDDAELSGIMAPFLLHVEETHDLSLAAGQRYPGVYRLLVHRDQGVRRIALHLANSRPTFKDEHDLESIQPTLEKSMHCLEFDSLDPYSPGRSKAGSSSAANLPYRPRAIFSKDALWIGLMTILSVLETPAFLKGVMEKYPMFVSIVLNHVSEATGVFWNALKCLKLLLEVLGYKLWLGTTFAPGVMRNTLLSQCFHSHDEKIHVRIFDVCQPFLKSLEALPDGEYENQRRRLLYFLLQQVPMSKNFTSMVTKKARQVAFSIIGRAYSMVPPSPPVECAHFWGPPLVATLKDSSLVESLKRPAIDLMQSIVVADAAALSYMSAHQTCLPEFHELLPGRNEEADDAGEEMANEKAEADAKHCISFLSLTKSVEACEQWRCLPLLWMEVLNGIIPKRLPSSFSKAVMWALGRLSVIDLERRANTSNMVVSEGIALKTISTALEWAKPKGYDDGAHGEYCENAVRVETHREELIGILKLNAGKYLGYLKDDDEHDPKEWTWEPVMAEPCILLQLDASTSVREIGKVLLQSAGEVSSVDAGLALLCSSEASAAALNRGLRHATQILYHQPLNQCLRGLSQFFFYVWKILTLNDTESEGFMLPTKACHHGVHELQRNEGALRKLCTLIAPHMWPLLVKVIVERKKHVQDSGQLMTFTRMLQTLPSVFRNLGVVQKKQVFLTMIRTGAYVEEYGREGTWFSSIITWLHDPSAQIRRWSREAVATLLKDLKRYEHVVRISDLEDAILDLQNTGLLMQDCRVQVMSVLRSIPSLVMNIELVERRHLIRPRDTERREQLPLKFSVVYSPDLGTEDHANSTDIIDLTHELATGDHASSIDVIDFTNESPVREFSSSKECFDLIHDVPERPSYSSNGVIDLTKDRLWSSKHPHKQVENVAGSAASSSPKLDELHLDGDDPQSRRQEDINPSGKCVVWNLFSKEHGKVQEESQFRRPPMRRTPMVGKQAPLDCFLDRFRSEKARKEASQKPLPSQGGKSAINAAASTATRTKTSKAGSKLAALRSEHREDIAQRSSLEGLARSQVKERIKSSAVAKQSYVVSSQQVDNKHLNAHLPDVAHTTMGGSEQRIDESGDAILRGFIRPDDAAPSVKVDGNAKYQVSGLKEVTPKPKRKLIALQMPGEHGRLSGWANSRPLLPARPRKPPRLDDWYKLTLSLDYLSVVGISDEKQASSGGTSNGRLEKIPLTFESPEQYVSIFQPVVLEEFKSQLRQAHEELSLADGTTTGVLRQMSLERVDDFQMGRFMAEAGSDNAARACMENELLLLSRQPMQCGSQNCHLLAKVESRDRESKSRATVLLLRMYIQPGNALLTKAKRLLLDRSRWHVTRIMNITPQVREWQALSSVSHLPVLPVLLSPDLGCADESLKSVSSSVALRSLSSSLRSKLSASYNESQLQAIAAVTRGAETSTDDNQLTLIQGPPGTGKTKTIVAMLSVLLARRSSMRNCQVQKQSDSPISGISCGTSRISAVKSASSSRDAAAMSRAWQDAAIAKDAMKESERQTRVSQGQKPRVLVCAQSNAAVDELVARICENGLYGPDGSYFTPSVVRVGNLKSVHPNSLKLFIDTLVDERLGADASEKALAQESEETKMTACRSSLEEVIEFIHAIEVIRSQTKGLEGETTGKKTALLHVSALGASAAKIIALGDSAVTAKLNLLYRRRRELTAELATAEKEGKKAYEVRKIRRKSIRMEIIRQADVVITTLSGCGGDVYSVVMESVTGGKECFFDAVVIDEAAQAVEPATLIPLQLLVRTNARCVLVGDPKQLPATVLSQVASKMQYECSMFERLQRAGYPVTLLSMQYRMHPEIRQFPSAHFYDNRIADGPGLKAARRASFHAESQFGPYAFFDVLDGQENRRCSSASQSWRNEAEVMVALQLYVSLQQRYPGELRDGRVGMITPYKQQLRLLQEEFVKRLGQQAASEVEFNTVDGFQGREVDILILSTVRASPKDRSRRGDIGFVADVRRMNVALTRARLSLWIIGNAATLQGNPSWSSLLSNASRRSLIFPVKRPYGILFQKAVGLDTTRSSRFVPSAIEEHKISDVRRDGQVSCDWFYSDSEGASGGPKENRAYVDKRRQDVLTPSTREMRDSALLNAAHLRPTYNFRLQGAGSSENRSGLPERMRQSGSQNCEERSDVGKRENYSGVTRRENGPPRPQEVKTLPLDEKQQTSQGRMREIGVEHDRARPANLGSESNLYKWNDSKIDCSGIGKVGESIEIRLKGDQVDNGNRLRRAPHDRRPPVGGDSSQINVGRTAEVDKAGVGSYPTPTSCADRGDPTSVRKRRRVDGPADPFPAPTSASRILHSSAHHVCYHQSGSRIPARSTANRTDRPSRAITSKGRSSDAAVLDQEWVKFEKALEQSQSKEGMSSVRTHPGLTERTGKGSQKALKNSEKPPHKQTGSLSDVDSILAGLSSVAEAQVRGNKKNPSACIGVSKGSPSIRASKHL